MAPHPIRKKQDMAADPVVSSKRIKTEESPEEEKDTEPTIVPSNDANPIKQNAVQPAALTDPQQKEEVPQPEQVLSTVAAGGAQPPDSFHYNEGVTIFDYEKEVKRVCEETGEYYFKGCTTNDAAFREKCKQNKFYYKEERTLLAAMELDNRKRLVLTRNTRYPDDKILEYTYKRGEGEWERRKILNPHSHKNPCGQCGIQFADRTHEDNYYWGIAGGRFNSLAMKTCTGCFGRTMCSRYGSDHRLIMFELQNLRLAQGSKRQPKVPLCPVDQYEYEYLDRAYQEREGEILISEGLLSKNQVKENLQRSIKEADERNLRMANLGYRWWWDYKSEFLAAHPELKKG